MNYEETVELEENVKIKKRAEKIYNNFLNNVKLEPVKHKGNGRFLYWSDSHNSSFFKLNDDGTFTYQARFLHESYDVDVTPSGIFSALKRKYRGVEHLEATVNK